MTERQARMGHNARLDEYNRSLQAFFQIEAELDAVKDKHKQEQELFTEQQKDIREELKECGLSLKVFNEMVKQTKTERQRVKRLAKLEPHVLHELDVLRESLASLQGTPLGDAALQTAATALAKVHGFDNGSELLSRMSKPETDPFLTA